MKRIFCFLVIITAGCKQQYDPPIISTGTNYLVVEGMINTGQDSTRIRLSRTTKLRDSVVLKLELNAQVSVESEDNSAFTLSGDGQGNYSNLLVLDNNLKYRLRIITSNGKVYLSDFEEAKKSPSIDSISWRRQQNGVGIYVSTHDDNNKTLYYRWDFEETWEFRSNYQSNLEYINGIVQDRTDDIFTCWKSEISKNILLGSSVKLIYDVITLNPLTTIPETSDRLNRRYSILVKQYALTKEAYRFWTNLKKNTEQVGSIFDAQPSQLTGNIHCFTDPKEPVIGYISVGDRTEKRFFISYAEIPDWIPQKYLIGCELFSTLPDSAVYFFENGNYLPIYRAPIPRSTGFRIVYSSAGCVDCRLRGTNVKPDFW